MSRSGLLWFVASLSLAMSSAVHARTSHGVEVTFACASVSEAAFAAALEIELGSRASERTLRVAVRCAGDTASLETAGLPTVVTRLDREGRDVRPRLLALAVAELVRDHDALPLLEPPTARALPAPPRASPAHSALTISLPALVFRSQRPLLLGAELGFAHAGSWLVPSLGAGFVQGERDASLGSLRTQIAYLRPGLSLSRDWGVLEVRLGGSLALGHVRLSAHGLEARARRDTVRGVWVGPELTTSFLARLQTRLWLVVRGTLGATLRAVTGEVEGARDASAAGLFASLGLGLEVRL